MTVVQGISSAKSNSSQPTRLPLQKVLCKYKTHSERFDIVLLPWVTKAGFQSFHLINPNLSVNSIFWRTDPKPNFVSIGVHSW